MAAAKILQNTHPEKIIIKEVVETIRRFISDQSTYNNIYLIQTSFDGHPCSRFARQTGRGFGSPPKGI
jgi:hypothetical protein